MKNNIMTTQELASYIKLNEKTVLKMAQAGKIPGIKIGSQWRFHLDSIDKYLQGGIVASNEKDLDLIIKTGVNIFPLSRLISDNLIIEDLNASSADEVLIELTNVALREGILSSKEKYLKELRGREKMLSTAIGGRIAIPHPRHPSDKFFKKPNIMLAISRKGINFKAPDERTVKLFFMTCAPNEFVHLRLLAKISRLLHEPNIVKKFLQSDSKEEIIQILLNFERNHFLLKD